MADIAADLGVTESRISQLRAEALSLLKDGLNTHLDPELAPKPENPESITARRRASYYSTIAGNTSVHSRLAMTNPNGYLTGCPRPPELQFSADSTFGQVGGVQDQRDGGWGG